MNYIACFIYHELYSMKNFLILLSGPSIKRKVSYTLLVMIRKRISLLQTIIEDITFGLFYIRFGTKLYRQIVGIPMGTNCAPLVADLF